jgi:hypothetical protein
MAQKYKIRYAVIDPHLITNKLAPNREQMHREEKERAFFSKLEASILEQGFRNPINVWAHADLIEPRYGGSRLYFAQKHNIPIPCIISDHADRFPDAPEITVQQCWKKFTDPPRKIYPTPRGLNMSGCEHVHLKRKP